MKARSFFTMVAVGMFCYQSHALPVSTAPSHSIAAAPLAQIVDFDIKLPLRNSAELDTLIHVQSSAGSPMYRHFLSPAQFRATFGASPATRARAESSLRASGFTIARIDSQLLHVRGSAATIARAFHSQIGIVRNSDNATRLAALSPLVIPASLQALGATVTGLSTMTVGPKPMLARAAMQPLNRYSKLGSYWFDDLKQAYAYPAYAIASGKGVTIATVGPSDFSGSDADLYFAQEGLVAGGLGPKPTIKHLLLPGYTRFDPKLGISDEANLDVQQVGGSAPGATVMGVAFGTQSEFLDTYSYLDETNVADIVSTSYGECELYYTAAYNHGTSQVDILQSYHDLFRQGNAEGITFIFSSGDNSGIGCGPVAYLYPPFGKTYDPVQHGAGMWVDDPNVTGVGGTNLVTSFQTGSLQSSYVSENEIGDRIGNPVDLDLTGNFIINGLWGSGGGPSSIFAKPSFQKLVATGYGTRAVPDVSMHMGGCPLYIVDYQKECDVVNRDSSDVLALGGQLYGALGTSASAPEFAGLLAVKESVVKSRLGNENEDIYRLAAANATGHYFHQGIPAYNGIVRIARGQLGYNPIVGVGTPIAKNFVGLPDAPFAGDPQTASNP